MFSVLTLAVAIAAAALLLTAGYLYGAASGRDARAKLRTDSAAWAQEVARLRDRIAVPRAEDELRAQIQAILTPLVQRERVAHDLARLDSGGGTQRDLAALLDQIADKGNLTAVLLSDEQGLPLAASSRAQDLERLGATASLLLLMAERLSRDGGAAPLSLTVHDAVNNVTLSRLFSVSGQRLLLTAMSVGDHLTPAMLDPALVKLDAALLNK